jgi:hypothetical protein
MVMKSKLLIAVASAALFVGAAASPGQAAGLSIGGISVGTSSDGSSGTTATVSAGDTSTSVSIGGGSNVAPVSTDTGANTATVSISTTDGSLVTAAQDGSATDASVNLGALDSLLSEVLSTVTDTVDGSDNGDGSDAGGDDGGLGAALLAMDAGDRQVLRIKCHSILANPSGFSRNVVALCKMIATL